jgi:hypothetical protein
MREPFLIKDLLKKDASMAKNDRKDKHMAQTIPMIERSEWRLEEPQVINMRDAAEVLKDVDALREKGVEPGAPGVDGFGKTKPAAHLWAKELNIQSSMHDDGNGSNEAWTFRNVKNLAEGLVERGVDFTERDADGRTARDVTIADMVETGLARNRDSEFNEGEDIAPQDDERITLFNAILESAEVNSRRAAMKSKVAERAQSVNDQKLEERAQRSKSAQKSPEL